MNLRLPTVVLLLAVATGCARSSHGPVAQEDSAQIIGGQFVDSRDTAAAKSLVHLKIMQGSSVVSGCSATLIDKETVLTAAHCLDGSRAFDQVLVEFTLKPLTDKTAKVGVMTGFTLHPKYKTQPFHTTEWKLNQRKNVWESVPKVLKGQSYDHDIAVLVFRGQIPPGHAPIELDRDENRNYAGAQIQVYGYGMSVDWDAKGTPELNKRRYDLRRGNFVITESFDRESDAYNTLANEKSTTWTCQGDSGGPQFFTEGGVTKQIGVNSTSNGPVIRRFKDFKGVDRVIMSCKGSGKAIRVAPFANWILRERQKLLSDSKTDPRTKR